MNQPARGFCGDALGNIRRLDRLIVVTPSVRLLVACFTLLGAVPATGRAAELDEPKVGAGAGARGHDRDAKRELEISLTGRSYSIRYPSAGSLELSGLGERFRAVLIDFLVPVRDDGAPYSLQSYLQRTSSVSLHVDLGHFETDDPFRSPLRTDSDADLGGGVSLYPRSWLNLFASASYDYDSLSDTLGGGSSRDTTTHSFFGSGGAGLRVGDTLLSASYYASKPRTSGSPLPFRQGVALSAFAALARRFTISLFGETVPQGGDGQLALEYFRSPTLGIFASGLAGKGQFYRSGPAVSRYGGSAGLAGWMYGAMALEAEYSFTYESEAPPTAITATQPTDVGYHQITHALVFRTKFRFH